MDKRKKILFLIDSDDDVARLNCLIEIHGRNNIVGLVTPGLDKKSREKYESAAINSGIEYYSIPISLTIASIVSQLESVGINVCEAIITDYLPKKIKDAIYNIVYDYVNENEVK